VKYRRFAYYLLVQNCLLTLWAYRFYDICGYAAKQEARPNDTAEREPHRSFPSMLFRVTIAHIRWPIHAPHTILLDKMSLSFCTLSLSIRFSACSLHSGSSKNILYAFIMAVLCTDLQLSLNRYAINHTNYVYLHY
jgi:hypothetical protein